VIVTQPPALHAWFAPHATVADSNQHPWLSFAHVAYAVALVQTFAADVHADVLHVQLAEPAAPVQLSFVLRQAAGVP
jgi:hypothetical protein